MRGLTLTGLGTAAKGIKFNSGGYLAIENCVIEGFTGAGINISPSTPSSSFSVSNTIASNNPGAGIIVEPTGSGAVTGVLRKVTANNNTPNGIGVDGRLTTGASLNVTIVDSEASNNNLSGGVAAISASGHPAAVVMLRNVVASYNHFGLDAEVNAILRIAHSVITGNDTGLSTFGGILDSYGDNEIDGNTFNNTSALMPLAMH